MRLPAIRCNLAPLCRRHHQAKQAQGWQLHQPEPGELAWRLPHGRSYRAGPDPYPVGWTPGYPLGAGYSYPRVLPGWIRGMDPL